MAGFTGDDLAALNPAFMQRVGVSPSGSSGARRAGRVSLGGHRPQDARGRCAGVASIDGSGRRSGGVKQIIIVKGRAISKNRKSALCGRGFERHLMDRTPILTR